MKYADLFTLNAIESIIEIADAVEAEKAHQHVSTFVVTPSLARDLTEIVVPLLDPSSNAEGKGLFIVGNYGTGKSHLMSFISVIAENADSLGWLREPQYADSLKAIAGKYIVRRHDINVVDPASITLYDVIAQELTKLCVSSGVNFAFKPSNQLVDLKGELQLFMTAFETVHPDKSVLLVIDEVLDHLRRLTDPQLIRDLGTLRALGEFSDGSRLKFMAGVQQSLFNNQRFQHVAAEISRIRQRYADVVIDSKGVEQLIQSFLFEKTSAQKSNVKEILLKQRDLFEIIGQEIDRFVNLFPVHPKFIEEFVRMTVVEKRGILKVLTAEGRALQPLEVEEGVPSLITADKYWPHIERDKGLDADYEVRQVKQNVATLKSRIDVSIPEVDRVPATRLVEALAVNRLTTATKKEQIGLTPGDLKDSLLWFTPIPMRDSSFLTKQAKSLLEKVREAANGQFLTKSPTSDHYYIDPTLNRDFEQEVHTESRTLSPDVIQRYLNELVTRALDMTNESPVVENRLYNAAVQWVDKNVERPGWFFFGYPNLRSTGNPPKDFYIFICPSTRIQNYKEHFTPERDEAYWYLEGFPSARFEQSEKDREDFSAQWLDKLRIYTAARERASAVRKGQDEHAAYSAIAERILRELLPEFNSHANDWVTVQYDQEKKPLGVWMNEVDPNNLNASFQTKFKSLNQWWFAAAFAHKFPDYPRFTMVQTESTRPFNARAAIEIITETGFGIKGTEQGKCVLNALGLYSGGVRAYDQSPWLKEVKARLSNLGDGQYINASDLFEEKDGRKWFKGENLEAEWLLVALVAGIAEGDLIIVGKQNNLYDASKLSDLFGALRTVEDVVRIGKPKSRPQEEWKALFGVLGLNKGELAHESKLDQAIGGFVDACNVRIEKLVRLQEIYKNPLPFQMLDQGAPEGLTSRIQTLKIVQDQLESLKNLNSKAKMTNLRLSTTDIKRFGDLFTECSELQNLDDLLAKHGPILGAIKRYDAILKDRGAEYEAASTALATALHSVYGSPQTLADRTQDIESLIESAKTLALSTYQELHKKHRLDAAGLKRKQLLTNGTAFKQFRALSSISNFGTTKLDSAYAKLESLTPYSPASDEQLLKSATSLHPIDGFDPSKLTSDLSAVELLESCEKELDATLGGWVQNLLSDLDSDPMVQASISALSENEKKGINEFLNTHKLPDVIDTTFISAVNQVFRGVKKRVIKKDAFTKAIFGDGVPLRPDDLKQRVSEWITSQLDNEDPMQIRFVVEE